MIVTAPASLAGHSDLARAVAAVGLAGSMLEFPDVPLEPEQWSALMVEVRGGKLTGLLWRAISEGLLPVTEEQCDEAEWLHVHALGATVMLERLLLETLATLAEADVPVRVLKGTASAHLDYPDPSLRTFGDIDLLVPADRFDAAVQTFVALGYRRTYPEPRPGFDRRFSKGASFSTGDGLEIDLHRTFTMGPFGIRLDLGRLWNSRDEFDLAGTTVTALGPEERFLHACYHASLGETAPKLTPLRDLLQLALTRELDLPRLHALVRASGGEPVVSHAIRVAWNEYHVADVTALSAWAAAYRTDPREAADLAAYGVGSSYVTKSVSALRSLPRLRDRAAFLYALLVPARSYVDKRHAGRLSRMRSAARQARSFRGAA